MKRLFWMAVCMAFGVLPVRAEYQKGNQSLSFSLGTAGYSHDMKVNNGDNTLRDCGGSGGIQYLYYAHQGPTVAVGPDLLWTELIEKDPSAVVAGGESKSDAHTALYQMMAKLAYPSGHWRPYVLGGFGAFRSSLQSHITSAAGVDMQTFDSIRYGVAGTWGAGIDWFPREHWFLGLELRQAVLSRLLHEPTEQGRALGIQTTRDPSTITAVMVKVGYKFGS